MAQTRIIEPTKITLKTDDNEHHNVCAYCRVSTDEYDQRNSLVSQKRFFESYFSSHDNWTNVGVFADEGISGTSIAKRDEFNKMLSLARKKKIDIILTKEVSRFSRNVLDLLNIVEELREKGVYVWFLSDNINTESNDYRDRLSQIATNAEQESLRTSRRVKWGQQMQMQNGVVFGRKEMYGYNIVKNKYGVQEFEIIEEEADVIKLIFEWFSEGDGTHTIARRLEERGIKTKRYKNGWSNTVILRLLRNEKYVGDLAQGKTYTPNPLTHKKKYNRGESHRFYIIDHHPESAIISRDLWDKVQKRLKENEPNEEIKAKYSNRYWTSGKIYCGICGGRYVSYNKKQKNSTYKAWVCFKNHQRGQEKEVINDVGEVYKTGCNNKRVNDKVLKIAMKDIITQVVIPRYSDFCKDIADQIKTIDPAKDNSKKIKSCEKSINALTEDLKGLTRMLIKGTISESVYLMMREETESKISELQAEILTLKSENTAEMLRVDLNNKIDQIKKIASLSNDDINEELFERITKKIIVHPLNVLELHLSFLINPIYLRYRTEGRGEDYNAIFDILSREEIDTLTQN